MSWYKANLSRMGLLLVIVIPGLLQLAIFGALIQIVLQAEVDRRGVEHAKKVMTHVSALVQLSDRLTTSVLINMAGRVEHNADKPSRERMKMIEEARTTLASLKKLSDTSGSAQGRALLKEISAIAEEIFANIAEGQKLGEGHGYSWEMRESLRRARLLSQKLHSALDRVSQLEYQQHSVNESHKNRQVMVLAIALGCNFIFTLLSGGFYSRQIARRLSRVSETSVKMASNLPLGPALTGCDEIARLDQVLHNSTHALEELSKRERALAENVNDVICSLDEQACFLEVNTAAIKEWGLDAEKLSGVSILDLVIEEDREIVKTQIAAVKTEETGARVFEARAWRADDTAGHYLWSVSYSPVDQALFCVAHDITDSKELEQLRQRFLAMVSHDLRSPLTSILALLNVVTAGGCGEVSSQAGDQLHQAEKSMTKLIGLINDLLDVERLNADKMPITQEKVMLAPLIEKSIEMVLELAERSEVDIDADGTLAHVYADPDRLQQVLANLLSNAIKHAPEGAAVTIKVENEDKKLVRISVSHAGSGMEDDDSDAIFDLYQQGVQDSSQTRSSAIGLAICKAIVEKHGGRIGVDVDKEIGSNVWFTIPAQEGVQDVA